MTKRINKRSGNEGLIQPRKGKSEPGIGPDALLILIPDDLRYLAKYCRAEKIARIKAHFFEVYQAAEERGVPFTLSGPFLGAPQAVMGMEKLIALGAERIWALGYCGSLHPDLRIGDFLIPLRAASEEGTSQHYPIGDRAPASNSELNQRLAAALKGIPKPLRQGAVWTTDAPYRETPEKIKGYRAEGLLAVEMEMSALMTVAIFRQIKFSGLLVVSDELFDMKWHSGFSNPELKKASRLAGELLVDVVRS